jgi:nicotinate dehydrogenase subunit B
LPLTPERVRAALADPASERPARKKRWWTELLAAVGAAGVAVVAFSPWQASIAPIPRPSADVYASATIERGRIIAAVGDCAVCHTAEGGAVNAGGRPVETPFGRIYSTNITPDMATGIGAWSYPAFERAMRQGISRDGHHLYPAFPYTAFTKMADADLQALYAYLQAQAPVRSETPPAAMRIPFGFRPAMALWNAMFLTRTAFAADPGQSELWNRGAYLAEAVGHCGACHTSRNLLGAERSGPGYDGAMIDGWEAPALGTATRSPLPWSEASLYDYLRTGNSASHGPALGPMKAVVDQLRTVPDSDVRAISAFIAALAPTGASGTDIDAQARAVEARSSALASVATGSGARTFAGACAVCHVPNAPTLLDAKPSLALNSNVHSDRPDNLVRTILDGVAGHGAFGRGAMPGFREHFNDRQTAGLVDYIRRTYAPDRAPWGDLEKTIARIRKQSAPPNEIIAKAR